MIYLNFFIAFNFFLMENSRKEFYLISQSTNQGTVSPTHFHVVYDDSDLLPERIQNFTYRLTHLYFNWPVSSFNLSNKFSNIYC